MRRARFLVLVTVVGALVTGSGLAEGASLRGHWPLNDGVGTQAADQSGHGLTATLVNTTWAASSPMPSRLMSVAFPGPESSPSYAAVAGVSVANASFTFAAWVKRDRTGTTEFIVGQGNSTSNGELALAFRSNDAFTCSFFSNDLDVSGYAAITDTTAWHHWACTYDVAAGRRAIFLDGVKIAEQTAGVAPYVGTGTLNLGLSGTGYDGLAGNLADVRVYDGALAEAEVAALATPSLVGWWRFDEGAGDLAADSSAYARTATLTGTTWAATSPLPTQSSSAALPGSFGGGLSPSYGAVTGVSVANSSFTIAAWVKRDRSGAKDFIVGQASGMTNREFAFGFRSSNAFTCSFFMNDLDAPATPEMSDTTAWHHWACTYDVAAGRRAIFLDGEKIAEQASGIAAYLGDGTLYLGRSGTGYDGLFGKLADVRLYDRALSASEAAALGSDVDECALGTDDCADGADCTNTFGSFTCTCRAGYTGNGKTCARSISSAATTLSVPATLAADGHSRGLVVLTVRDTAGQVVADLPVTFGSLGFGVQIVDPTGNNGALVTDANGQAVVYARSTMQGPQTVRASWAGGVKSATITFAAPASNATRSLSTPSGTWTLSVEGAGVYFSDARLYAAAALPAGLPAGTQLPYGVVAFTIVVPTPGDSVTVTATLPLPLQKSHRLWNYGPTLAEPRSHWTEFSSDSHVGGWKDGDAVYTVTLTDGGYGDADGEANGRIVDPQGPGQNPADVPTLGEWALILLAFSLMAVAVRRLRAAPGTAST